MTGTVLKCIVTRTTTHFDRRIAFFVTFIVMLI